MTRGITRRTTGALKDRTKGRSAPSAELAERLGWHVELAARSVEERQRAVDRIGHAGQDCTNAERDLYWTQHTHAALVARLVTVLAKAPAQRNGAHSDAPGTKDTAHINLRDL